MTEQPSYIIDPEQHVSIMFADGQHETIYATDDRFDDLIESIVAKQWKRSQEIVNRNSAKLVATVESISDDRVALEHGVVKVDGVVMHSSLTSRMLEMAEAGFDIAPMRRFLTNLADNPSYRAVHELYDFMTASDLPITNDGHFLAYKRIKANYTDCHTGTMDNSIGATVEMSRNAVNDNRDETCSAGLHFCSKHYLRSFNGDRLVVVKINPADVVSIPSDYNDSKGRACKYVVLQEIENDIVDTPLEALPVATKMQEIEVIQQLDAKDGTVLREYETVEEAAEMNGSRVEYIERVISGDRKTTGGYGWVRTVVETEAYDLSAITADDEDHEDDILDFLDDDEVDQY